MRIADQQLFNNFVRAFSDNRARTSVALSQLTDGRRVHFASDDPSGARSAIQFRGRLARLEGYTRAASGIRTDLQTLETALGEAFDLVLKARSDAELGASGTVNDGRSTLAAGIDQIRAQLLQLANTEQGDRFLFGGTETLAAPFDAAGAYQGNADETQGPLDERVDVGSTLAGDRAFQGAGNVFQTLTDLALALRNGDTAAIQGLLPELSRELEHLNQVRAEIGTRLNLVDAVVDRHADESVRLSTRIAEIEGIDLERVAVDLAAANNSNGALSTAAATVLGRSLFDYLG